MTIEERERFVQWLEKDIAASRLSIATGKLTHEEWTTTRAEMSAEIIVAMKLRSTR